MDAQGTMRLMFDTMDAYDRADFDRLAEIYAEGAQWLNANPKGPHCHNREDIVAMFRQRLIDGGGQRSSDAALVASRSLSPITVAPELSGRGAVGPHVASRLNSRKKS
jgi:hypothetical protein